MATKTINTILNLKDKFSGKLKEVSDLTKKQSRQMQMLNNNIDSFKQTAVTGFANVARSAAGVGAAFLGVSAAVATMESGIQFIKDYNSSLKNLQAATGVTKQEIVEMKDQITDLYKQNMGESWSDLTNAMTLTKQVTGQVGDQLKQTTALAVTYRDTFGEDLTTAIRTADTMMKNFGISSTQAFNLMAQGAQNGLNKSGDLLDTANEYSVYFKTLGFNANEMFNIFSAGAEKGAFNLDKVGDAVKEFGIRIKDDSKTTKEALSALGFNANKMMQTFAKGGDGAKQSFRQVVDAISKIQDPVKRNVIGVQLFGTQFEDMEKDVIAALGTARNQFDMTKNTMEQIGKIKYDSTSSAFKGIGRLIETSVLAPISNKLLPKLNEFGQWIKDNTPQIESAIDKTFTVGGKVVDGFATSINWAKQNADWLIPVVGGLTSAIAAQKVISTISGMYEIWTKTTKGLTVAQIALNLATKMTPFGWIATGIGLVIAGGIALYKNWDTVKAKGIELYQSLKQGASDMGVNVSNFFKSMANGVIQSINKISTGINELLGTKIPQLEEFKLDYSVQIRQMKEEKLARNLGEDIPHYALGTSYTTKGLALMHERGGEIRQTSRGETIIPADKSEKIIEKIGNDRPITINIYAENKSINQIVNELVPQLKIALVNM
ncbi:phage tail tape measure protein [Brevibacillus agri]|uniref:phage tail tape measure protein n=1 Tax=Brevibacillus agri TaxID=51101 RepID=UPI0025B6C261|nr:phage tail tape measure protein [Brevibacillus agri]MDN4093577.1 phage tail tape measure protein [Brevibacillus agri]